MRERILLDILLLLCCAVQLNVGQGIRDTRCFLESGATAAYLFVSEDHKVGDIIGILNVLGDPGQQGDIELRLQERDSPVTFSPYSKNLTLSRPLDKEGIEGPASVFINVICERKHTLDPGFIIPVNIRVSDANDNAPQFLNAPYVLNISEVTVIGTRVLQGVRAVDVDQPGPFSTVQYAVIPGPNSDYFVFVNALEGTLVLRKALDYEMLSNFSVTIRAQDQGNPPKSSTTTLYVNVIDADDQNPAFLNDQYKVIIPQHIEIGKKLKVVPEEIQALDQDVGINAPVRYTIQGGILPFLDLDSQSGSITIQRSLYSNEIISPATIVIKATQVDNPDRYALSTIIVSREISYDVKPTADGRIPLKFQMKDYQTNVPENTPSGSVLLTTNVNKMDTHLKFWLVGATEDLERFSITNSGELILKGTLDYERRIQHSFLTHVTDGNYNDSARVNISVQDVNEWEPRFRHPRYEFHARKLREGTVVGRLEAADGDRGDKIRLSLKGPDASSFEIHDNGELILRSIGLFNGTLARLVAFAADSGKPQRSSMVPVIVHLPQSGSMPIAARAAPAWLGSSVLLIAVFGSVLGILGVVILILILYIYKHKRPKSGNSVSSVGTGYREKSPVPSALSPTPQILAANALQDIQESPPNRQRSVNEIDNDIDNPVYGEDNEESNYGATIKSILSGRRLPLYTGKRKIAPLSNPPALSASSNIPNVGGLVENMNDLSARSNHQIRNGNGLRDSSSTYTGDQADSLGPVWPNNPISPKIRKLSWNNEDEDDNDSMKQDNKESTRMRVNGTTIVDSIETIESEAKAGNSHQGTNERLNLTVYF